MIVSAELLSIKNPSPSHGGFPLKGPLFRASAPAFTVKFESLFRPRGCRASSVEAPKGLGFGVGFGYLERRKSSLYQSILPFAASHEESKHSDIEVEKEKDDHMSSEESNEAWKQALASFKEQALKIQSVSQEAYDIYSKKAMVFLKENSEQLNIQSEKAREDLAALAREISEEGKEYISSAAENSPEPVKEVVETFSSSIDDLNDISKVRDFYIGIPYGLLLSLGGFLSFMVTGSISAIRFGVILGGALLALSVSSLRSYKRKEPYGLVLKGQAAISTIIFLRDIHLLSKGASVFSFLTTVVSGIVAAFYVYRIAMDRKPSKGTDLGHGVKN